jgi:hypothetical protein
MPRYYLNPGFERNVLKRYRNMPCFCGSNEKIKRCHGMLAALTTDQAKLARRYLRHLSAAGFIEVRPDEIAEPKASP